MKKKVTVHILGRLGNVLYQIATGASYAVRTGRDLLYLRDDPYDNEIYDTYGFILDKFDELKTCTGTFQLYKDGAAGTPIIPDFPSIDDLHIRGYFASLKQFDPQLTRWLFAPSQEIIESINIKYGCLTDACCMSVRRGDYVGIGWAIPAQWYIEQYERYFKDKRLIIKSDDIEWCRENLPIDGAVYADDLTLAESLYFPTLCKYNIICNSTFAWWGAYLNRTEGRITISPAADEWYPTQTIHKDLLPEWVEVPVWDKYSPDTETKKEGS